MIVVCDASVLINLVRIGELDLHLDALRDSAGFRLTTDLYERILRDQGEK
ncbi:MAG: hypothetical protein K6T87_18145 [Roseiflexus sp.]|jgi:predicted nucleic acid-binding protein|nr:hypothetical protein [Roseiflexus sp.]MCL6542481.1 hypothetical protein [Roseiflexus sp.]